MLQQLLETEKKKKKKKRATMSDPDRWSQHNSAPKQQTERSEVWLTLCCFSAPSFMEVSQFICSVNFKGRGSWLLGTLQLLSYMYSWISEVAASVNSIGVHVTLGDCINRPLITPRTQGLRSKSWGSNSGDALDCMQC